MTEQSTRWLDRYWVRDKGFYRKVILILIPIVCQSIINQGVNMMDTIMVGKLGEASISASSLANQFYNIFVFLCMGISAAGLVLSSQYFGAKDLKTVRRVFDLVLQIVIVGGAAFALVTFLVPKQIMRVFTTEQDVIELGAQYLRVTALIYLPHGISLVLSNVMRSIGNAKLGLYVSIASFIVNIGANYIFIFGKLGAPALGVQGAAIATVVSRYAEAAIILIYTHRHKELNPFVENLYSTLKVPGNLAQKILV